MILHFYWKLTKFQVYLFCIFVHKKLIFIADAIGLNLKVYEKLATATIDFLYLTFTTPLSNIEKYKRLYPFKLLHYSSKPLIKITLYTILTRCVCACLDGGLICFYLILNFKGVVECDSIYKILRTFFFIRWLSRTEQTNKLVTV